MSLVDIRKLSFEAKNTILNTLMYISDVVTFDDFYKKAHNEMLNNFYIRTNAKKDILIKAFGKEEFAKICRGRTVPKRETLIRIAILLDYDIDECNEFLKEMTKRLYHHWDYVLLHARSVKEYIYMYFLCHKGDPEEKLKNADRLLALYAKDEQSDGFIQDEQLEKLKSIDKGENILLEEDMCTLTFAMNIKNLDSIAELEKTIIKNKELFGNYNLTAFKYLKEDKIKLSKTLKNVKLHKLLKRCYPEKREKITEFEKYCLAQVAVSNVAFYKQVNAYLPEKEIVKNNKVVVKRRYTYISRKLLLLMDVLRLIYCEDVCSMEEFVSFINGRLFDCCYPTLDTKDDPYDVIVLKSYELFRSLNKHSGIEFEGTMFFCIETLIKLTYVAEQRTGRFDIKKFFKSEMENGWIYNK